MQSRHETVFLREIGCIIRYVAICRGADEEVCDLKFPTEPTFIE